MCNGSKSKSLCLSEEAVAVKEELVIPEEEKLRDPSVVSGECEDEEDDVGMSEFLTKCRKLCFRRRDPAGQGGAAGRVREGWLGRGRGRTTTPLVPHPETFQTSIHKVST